MDTNRLELLEKRIEELENNFKELARLAEGEPKTAKGEGPYLPEYFPCPGDVLCFYPSSEIASDIEETVDAVSFEDGDFSTHYVGIDKNLHVAIREFWEVEDCHFKIISRASDTPLFRRVCFGQTVIDSRDEEEWIIGGIGYSMLLIPKSALKDTYLCPAEDFNEYFRTK